MLVRNNTKKYMEKIIEFIKKNKTAILIGLVSVVVGYFLNKFITKNKSSKVS
jgi:H+/gluconate symporter-like permease